MPLPSSERAGRDCVSTNASSNPNTLATSVISAIPSPHLGSTTALWTGGTQALPAVASFMVRQLTAAQLIQEGRFILDDGLRHLHAYRTIVSAANDAASQGDQAQELSQRLACLETAPKTPVLEVQSLIDSIIRWRRVVQVKETSRWRSIQKVPDYRRSQQNERLPLGPSMLNSPADRIPRAPTANTGVASPSQSLPPSSNRNNMGSLPSSRPQRHLAHNATSAASHHHHHRPRSNIGCSNGPHANLTAVSPFGASISPINWGSNPAREAVALIDFLPLSPPPHQLQTQLRLGEGRAGAGPANPSSHVATPDAHSLPSASALPSGPARTPPAAAAPSSAPSPTLTRLSQRVVGVQLISETSVVVLFRTTADVVMLDNVWNLRPPAGYERVVVQLVDVQQL